MRTVKYLLLSKIMSAIYLLCAVKLGLKVFESQRNVISINLCHLYKNRVIIKCCGKDFNACSRIIYLTKCVVSVFAIGRLRERESIKIGGCYSNTKNLVRKIEVKDRQWSVLLFGRSTS
jgi:hypothetical protein